MRGLPKVKGRIDERNKFGDNRFPIIVCCFCYVLVDGNLSYGFRNSSDDRGDAEKMNDKEKLEQIYEIASLVMDYLCVHPNYTLIPSAMKIKDLSRYYDCFGTESCNAVEYGECMRADACSERASESQSMEETANV